MPDIEFVKHYAPWLAAYAGAADVPVEEVHASNDMIRALQLQRIAPLPQVRDAVAQFLIEGAVPEGFPVNTYEMGQLRDDGIAAFRKHIAGLLKQVVDGAASHTHTKVREFEAFARDALQVRYDTLPAQQREERLGLLMEAYRIDHGTPLFHTEETNDGQKATAMRKLSFPGVESLPDDMKDEYRKFSRTFAFGADSRFARNLREERFHKAAIAAEEPGTGTDAVDRKYAEKTYNLLTVGRRFKEAEDARAAFAAFAKAEINGIDTVPTDDRLRSYQVAMSQYDDEALSRDRIGGGPLRMDKELYDLLKRRFAAATGQGQEGGHIDKLKGDGSGRGQGPRRKTPRPDGPNEVG